MQQVVADTAKTAEGFSQYGAAGVMLACIMPFVIFLVLWLVRNSAKVLATKDAEISRINEQRADVAVATALALKELIMEIRQLHAAVKGLPCPRGSSDDASP